MARYTIRLVALAGEEIGLPPEWLKAYDPDQFEGTGGIMSTGDRSKARTFGTITEAWLCWNQVSTVRPRRPDGLPNKPLSAFTIAVEPLPEAS